MGSPMKHLLGTTDYREQRKGGFNAHSVIPPSFQTQFQIVGNTRFATKAEISQDDAIGTQQLDQRQKVLVTLMHWQPMPTDYLSQTIENPAQFHPNRPA